ncbi:unnamed protein product [Leptidea sinapis]|uniref:Rho-GAP domain-containing protein n=1 Tax=Leptidea sinapis TaxID=189913 RepID=A0A5E4PXP2_9NEOP|nr:unnamed protein product [Leptidea sinapis]
MASERVEWVEIIEPKTKEHMYANLTTGECVWDPPEGVKVKRTDSSQWWELFDINTHRFYYYNASTQTTVWHRPTDCDIIPLAKLQTLKQNTDPQKRRETSTQTNLAVPQPGEDQEISLSSQKQRRESSHAVERGRHGGVSPHRLRPLLRQQHQQCTAEEEAGLNRSGSFISPRKDASDDSMHEKYFKHLDKDRLAEIDRIERYPEKQAVYSVDKPFRQTSLDLRHNVASNWHQPREYTRRQQAEPERITSSKTSVSSGSSKHRAPHEAALVAAHATRLAGANDADNVAAGGSVDGLDVSGGTGKVKADGQHTTAPILTVNYKLKSINLEPSLTEPNVQRHNKRLERTAPRDRTKSRRRGRYVHGSDSENESNSSRSRSGSESRSLSGHEPDNESSDGGARTPDDDDGSGVYLPHAYATRPPDVEYVNHGVSYYNTFVGFERDRQPSPSIHRTSSVGGAGEGAEGGPLYSPVRSHAPLAPRPHVHAPSFPHMPPAPPEQDIEIFAKDNLNFNKGIFRRKASVRDMLSWTSSSISAPMVGADWDKGHKKAAIDLFRLVQIYMGDRKARPGMTLNSLCRQSTENPLRDSLLRGWELLAVCLAFVPPSPAFQPALTNYVNRHRDPAFADCFPEVGKWPIHVQVSHYASVACKRLERIGFGGKRQPRKPTTEDIDQARIQIFRQSMFGNTLQEVMTLQKERFPNRQLPWVQVALSQQVLALNGKETEGIFRVSADVDEVNALKAKIDNWELPDASMLTDAHAPASLLKLWYRELYEPLIPDALYAACVAAGTNVFNKLPATIYRAGSGESDKNGFRKPGDGVRPQLPSLHLARPQGDLGERAEGDDLPEDLDHEPGHISRERSAVTNESQFL